MKIYANLPLDDELKKFSILLKFTFHLKTTAQCTVVGNPPDVKLLKAIFVQWVVHLLQNLETGK